MKTIGLIGGISWHATSKYYQYINQEINNYFGDNTNPPLLISNINQSKMHKLQKENDWSAIAEMIHDGAKSLIKAGAESILICSNTTHKVVPLIIGKIDKPIIHIGDSTATHIKSYAHDKVGFIGTKFTMEDQFLLDRIRSHDMDVKVPENSSSILELHRIIHEELTYNIVTSASKKFVIKEIHKMRNLGAQGIILGCTEFSLMFEELDFEFPIFDTIRIHAKDAVTEILSDGVADK